MSQVLLQYTGRGFVDTGTSGGPAAVRRYGGEAGEKAKVPEGIAAELFRLGLAEPVKKPKGDRS